MTLGIALIVIFVLYLIDKHERWRIAAKLAVGLIALCILAVGCIFGWEKYDSYRTEKQQEAVDAARSAALQIKIRDCMAKSYTPPSPKTPPADFVEAYPADFLAREQKQCEANPEVPLQGFSWSKGQWIEWTDFIPDAPSSANKISQRVPRTQSVRHAKATSSGELTTAEFGDLKCGEFNEGEVVTLLEEGTIGIKVRTPGGQVGWAAAHLFEVVK